LENRNILLIFVKEINNKAMMKLSLLNDKDLCKALDILIYIDRIKYHERHTKITELQRLKPFGDAFKDWIGTMDIENIYMRMSFGQLEIIEEMSKRFINKFG